MSYDELLSKLVDEKVQERWKEAFKETMPDILKELVKPPIQDKIVSKQGLKSEVGISLQSINARMRDGSLPYLKLGRRVFFNLREVIEAMGNGKKKRRSHE